MITWLVHGEAASSDVRPAPGPRRRHSLCAAEFAAADVQGGAFAAPPRPAYPLDQRDRQPGIKLGETLGGAKIRGEQRAVDVQQGDQRHVREVVPFRQHLSTNQDARAAAMHFRQLLLQRPFTAGGIPVDTGDGYVREEGRERLFKLFRSQTDRHDVR